MTGSTEGVKGLAKGERVLRCTVLEVDALEVDALEVVALEDAVSGEDGPHAMDPFVVDEQSEVPPWISLFPWRLPLAEPKEPASGEPIVVGVGGLTDVESSEEVPLAKHQH